MRRVIYSIMVSLDGFIAGPNGELDWAIVDEELHRYVNNQESEIGAHLYGRRMYEVMSYWQSADTNPSSLPFEIEYAHIWQNMPKIVFSRTLEHVEGNARLVKENIAEEIAKLKAQPGKDMSLGGADITSTFIRLGLVDQYWLYVHPVVLGRGIPVFPSLDNAIDLRLVETHTFGSGVVFLRYQQADKEQ